MRKAQLLVGGKAGPFVWGGMGRWDIFAVY
jgi:hypothetical protein